MSGLCLSGKQREIQALNAHIREFLANFFQLVHSDSIATYSMNELFGQYPSTVTLFILTNTQYAITEQFCLFVVERPLLVFVEKTD